MHLLGTCAERAKLQNHDANGSRWEWHEHVLKNRSSISQCERREYQAYSSVCYIIIIISSLITPHTAPYNSFNIFEWSKRTYIMMLPPQILSSSSPYPAPSLPRHHQSQPLPENTQPSANKYEATSHPPSKGSRRTYSLLASTQNYYS